MKELVDAEFTNPLSGDQYKACSIGSYTKDGIEYHYFYGIKKNGEIVEIGVVPEKRKLSVQATLNE